MTADTARSLHLNLPLPWLPLAPNGSRSVRAKRFKAVADYRELCGWSARAQLPEDWRPPARARLSFTFNYCGAPVRDGRCLRGHRFDCRCEYRPRDWDNAASVIKGLQDGMVDAGVLVADDMAHATLGSIDLMQHPRGCTGHAHIVVTVEAQA